MNTRTRGSLGVDIYIVERNKNYFRNSRATCENKSINNLLECNVITTFHSSQYDPSVNNVRLFPTVWIDIGITLLWCCTQKPRYNRLDFWGQTLGVDIRWLFAYWNKKKSQWVPNGVKIFPVAERLIDLRHNNGGPPIKFLSEHNIFCMSSILLLF